METAAALSVGRIKIHLLIKRCIVSFSFFCLVFLPYFFLQQYNTAKHLLVVLRFLVLTCDEDITDNWKDTCQ